MFFNELIQEVFCSFSTVHPGENGMFILSTLFIYLFTYAFYFFLYFFQAWLNVWVQDYFWLLPLKCMEVTNNIILKACKIILSSAFLCLRILQVTLNSDADICISLVVMNVLS